MSSECITLIILLCLARGYSSAEMDIENLLVSHLDNISYSPSVRPSGDTPTGTVKGHQPTKIKVRMVINEIGALSETNNDFTVGVTINQMWFDKRMIFNQTFEFLSLTYLKARIWTPDLYFYNTKSVLGNAQMASLLWLYPNGTLIFSTTMRLTIYCRIVLWRFPLDTQRCHMELGSYGYPTEDIRLKWWYSIYDLTRNVILKDIYNTEFQYPTFIIEQNQSAMLSNGRFSILSIAFTFKRNFLYHVIYTFLPSTLIVCVSWVSFYIDYRAAPARIPFCLLTLLALMTQWSSINAALPRLSYLKCIDIWMFICMTFVIFSLFEYAAVNQLATKLERLEKKKATKSEPKKRTISELRRTLSNDSPFSSTAYKNGFTGGSSAQLKRSKKDYEASYLELNLSKKEYKPLFHPYDIDQFSTFAFPFFFVMVNIIFWCMLIFYD